MNGLTTIAALPQGGGCLAKLPAEVGTIMEHFDPDWVLVTCTRDSEIGGAQPAEAGRGEAEMIEVRISPSELMALRSGTDEMVILAKLKAAGMPLKGFLLFGGVERGRFERLDDFETGDMVFRWKDKKPQIEMRAPYFTWIEEVGDDE